MGHIGRKKIIIMSFILPFPVSVHNGRFLLLIVSNSVLIYIIQGYDSLQGLMSAINTHYSDLKRLWSVYCTWEKWVLF